MIHNRSTIVLAAVAAIGYLLYSRLSAEDKQEILTDVKQKTDELVNKYLASEKATLRQR